LPLTISDYDEFGNPVEDPLIYDLIYSYSPYENINISIEYPSVYIECGSSDFRCPLWNVLKYIKRFRDRVPVPKRVEVIGEEKNKNIFANVLEGGHFGDVSIESGIR
jgi:protease II